MSDTDERLAEIKKRAAHWEIGGTITDPVIREVTLLEGDYDWLVMRIRELETRAERDAKVIEAARAYRIAQRAIASACSPPFDPGVCTDAMVAQDEAEATLDAALAEREE